LVEGEEYRGIVAEDDAKEVITRETWYNCRGKYSS
jgi:hypothetical protein